MYSFKKIISILFLFVLISCSYQFPDQETEDEYVDGTDFSRFYVIGGTLTSGLMNGALYDEGQNFAFPNIVGDKISRIYNSDIYQPIYTGSERGFNPYESDDSSVFGKYELVYTYFNETHPARIVNLGDELNDWDGDIGKIRNYSFPGMKVSEVDDRNAISDNPYFNSFNPGNGSDSVLDMIVDGDPEIVLLSFGIDEILEPALRGGMVDINGENGSMNEEQLPGRDEFKSSLEQIVFRLLNETDSEILVVNIPDLLQSPYFTEKYFYFELGKEISRSEVVSLQQYYNDFNDKVFNYNYIDNGGADPENRRPHIDFDIDGPDDYRAMVIRDESLPDVVLDDGTELPKIRQLNRGEYLLYSVDPLIRNLESLGRTEPIDEQFVMRKDQIEQFSKKINEFNSVFSEITEAHNRVHLLDIHSRLHLINEQLYSYEGVTFSTSFNRYGIYSSDGFTLNPRGHAILANDFIDWLNEFFGVGLNEVNVNNYPGLSFDNDFDQ